MKLSAAIAALGLALTLAGAARADDAAAPEAGAEGGAQVRGWLELARVEPVHLLMRAKLDTGALTSALNAEILRGPPGRGLPSELAEDVEIDDAGGVDPDADAETVVFAIESRAGRREVLEREIVRWVNVKNRDGTLSTRPVVMLSLCVGGLPLEGEVGLTDRGDFNYPLLIGRRMLSDGKIMVAPWKTFTYRSSCFPDGPHPNDD